ncbi:MAG: iron-sulfur cluster assembly scaffold protein [bacterium]
MTKGTTKTHSTTADITDESRVDPREALRKALEIYSPTVVERWLRPRNRGSMTQPDGLGRSASDCQDTIEIFLRVRGERITGISFLSTGCGSTLASASMATELAEGKTLSEAMSITAADILEALDGLPAHNAHCADMAAGALRQAVQDALCTAREPWKKLYR